MKHFVFAAAISLALTASAAFAQDATQVVNSVAVSEPAQIAPVVSPDAVLLDEVQRNIGRTKTEVEMLRLELQRRELQGQLGEDSGRDVPELIGLYGRPDSMSAEFRVGASVLTATPGDWVTSRWQLKRVLSNGVELTQRGGGTRTVLFGNTQGSGQQGRPVQAAYSP